MPTSKNGKLYYTDEQYNLARYESSALEYAKAAGYQLEKKGGWWTMKDHDSFVFASNGMWFWNSRDMKGGAIEFLTQIEHKSLVEAVLTLAGERELVKKHESTYIPKLDVLRSEEEYSKYMNMIEERQAGRTTLENSEEKKPFELPPKADNYKRLFAYLCGTRGLDKEIVQNLVKQGKIYESATEYTSKAGDTRALHNAVFVGFDNAGNARGGFQRGLVSDTDHPFKRDVAGSEKEYAFCLDGGENVDTVAVFEASIDAISHATIEKLDGHDYKAIDRIALGGVAFGPLKHYLESHTNVKNIVLCVDADQAGNKAAESLKDELHKAGFSPENGFHCERLKPTGHKDFNEYLIAYRDALAEQNDAAQDQNREPQDTQEGDSFFPQAEP